MLRDGGVLEDAYMVTNAILKGSQVKNKGVPQKKDRWECYLCFLKKFAVSIYLNKFKSNFLKFIITKYPSPVFTFRIRFRQIWLMMKKKQISYRISGKKGGPCILKIPELGNFVTIVSWITM